MNDKPLSASFIIDSHALVHILEHGNTKTRLNLEKGLASGEICLSSKVWDEFKVLYPASAEKIKKNIKSKISTNNAQHHVAAAITDELGSPLNNGSHNNDADLYTAAIARISKIDIITTDYGIQTHSKIRKVNCVLYQKCSIL